MTELLVPAGSPDVFRTAVRYGAGAVYIGGEAFSLRAGAANFSPDEMRQAVELAHLNGVKVHVTANILAHNADLKEADAYFRELNDIRPDAILVADPGMFALARRLCPDIDLHISTQANNTNYATCLFWRDMGAKRIVMARELSLDEIREIREKVPRDTEIEAFVHGAMCISYSGRCLLSSYFTGRDANRGACAHPCRWQYRLMTNDLTDAPASYALEEATRPGEYLPVEENERGTFLYNSKDLCMVDHLPDLYEAGIDSFKIEGRMKTALYVATTTRTYRQAMTAYETDPALYEARLDWLRDEITEGTYRDFTTGFFYGRPDETAQVYRRSTYLKTSTYLGIVDDYDGGDRICLRQKNKFSVGEIIEILKPDGRNVRAEVAGIVGGDGIPVKSAPHPLEELTVRLAYLDEEPGFEPTGTGGPARPEIGDVIRRREKG